MMKWLEQNIAVICMAFGLLSGMFVMFSWGVGYYANALYGMHFDIFSCWQGMSAMGTGLVGLLKWLIDSTKNTLPGEYPGREKDIR